MFTEEITEELLGSLASGYPMLCAENTFISCKIKNGNVIPMEGVDQPALEKVITGDVLQKYDKSTRLIEKFQISYFLSMLRKRETTEEEYELESYPKPNMENRLNLHRYSQTHLRTQETSNHHTTIKPTNEKSRKESCHKIMTSKSFDSDSCEMHLDNMKQPMNIAKQQPTNVNKQQPTNVNKQKMVADLPLHNRIRNYIDWLSSDQGKDYIFTESFSSVKEASIVLAYLKGVQKPSLVTVLARENEPIIVTFSSVHVGLECVLFCLFQA